MGAAYLRRLAWPPRASGCRVQWGQAVVGVRGPQSPGQSLVLQRLCPDPASPPARPHLSVLHLGWAPGATWSQDGRVCFKEEETKAQKRGGANPRSHQGDETEPKTCTGCQLTGSSLRHLPTPLWGGRGLRDRCAPKAHREGTPSAGRQTPQPQRVLGCGTLRTLVTFQSDVDAGDNSGSCHHFWTTPFASSQAGGVTAEFTETWLQGRCGPRPPRVAAFGGPRSWRRGKCPGRP